MIVVQEFGKLSHGRCVHAFSYGQIRSGTVVIQVLLESRRCLPLPFADLAFVAPEFTGEPDLQSVNRLSTEKLSPLRVFYEAIV